MIRTPTTLLLALGALTATPIVAQDLVTVGFEGATLPLDTAVAADAADTARAFAFAGGVVAPSTFTTQFGGFWTGGWAVSTSRNDSVGDFTNLTGAAPGGAAEGTTYLVGQNGAYLLLPPNTRYVDVAYTNTAYAAAALRDGTSFNLPFGQDSLGQTGIPDSLILRVCGYEQGLPTFVEGYPLADFRSADDAADYIRTRWERPVLSGDSRAGFRADSISFRLESSSRGAFGNNTPDFFAVDELRLRVDVSSLTEREVAGPALTTYPNPCTDQLRARHGWPGASLMIADAEGRVVRLVPGYDSDATLDVSSLPAGLYYAVLSRGREQVAATFVRS